MFILHFAHLFTLQTSKICLSWTQDLRDKMYLDLMHLGSELEAYYLRWLAEPLGMILLCQ